MIEHEHEDNLLKQALGGFMDELISSEELEPDRIVAVGRERRRRRRMAASLGGAAAALIVASGVAYGLQSSGGGSSVAPAAGHTGTARVTRPASPSASVPPAGVLKGTVVSRGTTDGVSWEISAALDGYANGNELPQWCAYIWTSDGSSNPATCEGPNQPDPADPAAPSYPQAGATYGSLPKPATLAWAAISTNDTTKVLLTYAGGSITLHPVSLGHGVTVTGAVVPATGVTVVASGPGGTGGATHLSLTPPQP